MARTDQRSVPLALFLIALTLVAARVAVQLRAGAPAKNGHLVRWLSPEEAARTAGDKPILYDFTADWCAPCHQLDAEVFRDPDLAREINERFVAVRVTDRQREEGRNTPAVAALQQRYGVRGFPTVVFADASGRERSRMEGFGGRAEFERVLRSAR